MEVRVFFSRRSSLIFGLLTLLPLVRPQTRSIENLMAHYDCGTVSNDPVPQPPASVLSWTVSSIPCGILCLNANSGNCASFSWKASTRMCTLHSTETSRCSFSPGTQLAVTNPQSTSSTVQTSPLVTVGTVQGTTSFLTTVQNLTSTTALPNNASNSCPSIVCFENSRLSTVINTITNTSIQNCYDTCAANNSCAGFSYYNGNSTCTMYSSVLQVPVNDSGYSTCLCKKNIVQQQNFPPSCVSSTFSEHKMNTTTSTGSKCFICKCGQVFDMQNNNGVFFIPAVIPDFGTCRSFCSDSTTLCHGFAYKEQNRSCQLAPNNTGTASDSQSVFCTSSSNGC